MRFRPALGDVTGALGDLGVMVPMVAALVLVNGLDPGPILILAGCLVVTAGLVFRVPFPVQPLKALTALAVAQSLDPDVIHSAGLQIGVFFVVLAATGAADWLARLFTVPVIRSLQFAVGALLVVTATKLVWDPPAVFQSPLSRPMTVALAATTLAVVAAATAMRKYALIAVLFVAGLAVGLATSRPDLGSIAVDLPGFDLPPWSVAWSAFVLLVIPQIPLTYGNAVVGVSHLAQQQFGIAARRVTPRRVAMSCGVGNVVSGVLGGMPMCHGSSGFTAHVRLGARTATMNLLLGATFVTLGLVFSNQVLELFGLLPVWALAGFLAYAGIRHAALVLDLRSTKLAIALVAGVIGVVTRNLSLTTAVALAAEHGPALWRRGRDRRRSGR